MPITIAWDNEEKSVIRYDFNGAWTWNQYLQVMEELMIMMKSVEHRVDAIANMKSGIMPMSGSALSIARTALYKLPSNRGVVVVVTNPFVGVMLKTFKQFDREIGAILRAASSIEEANELILHERSL